MQLPPAVERIEKIESNFHTLLALLSDQATYKVPTVEDLETHARSRLDELKSLFIRGSVHARTCQISP